MYSHFSTFQFGTLTPIKNINPSIALSLEATRNIAPNTELGLGIGFIKRNGFNFAKSWLAESYQNQKPRPNGFGFWLGNEQYKVNRYSSLPIYLTLKQNFKLNGHKEINLYIKGDLGYSFNKIKNTYYSLDSKYINAGRSGVPESIFFPVNIKAKNGLYYGLAVGAEYKNLLAEIGYYRTHANIVYNGTGLYKNHYGTYEKLTKDKHTINGKSSYNNDAIRLSVGFKF
ncbi:hypothetical protein RZ69_07430 [[Haemophilus] ducreyi]|nr:hypothetical protein RZ68_07480 [[Haemophilus] ducreyi]AKO50144.1 hypothetical protein RZ69_07430 [[Haemophilus] ducreyi]